MTHLRNPILPSLLAVVVVAVGVVRCDDYAENEFLCEEAVAHLGRCCPGFDAGRLVCQELVTGGPAGCGGSDSPTVTRHPDFSVDESRCLIDRDCATMVSSGLCETTQTLVPNQDVNYSDCFDLAGLCRDGEGECQGPPCNSSSRHPPVCP